MPAAPAAPPAAEPFADGLLAPPGRPAGEPGHEPTGEADRPSPAPSVLDRFLWTVVKEADEEAILNFMLTPKESRRLWALEKKRESAQLTHEEQMAHFDLKVVREVGPLLKVAVDQKRAGWRGGAMFAEEAVMEGAE